jgi:thiol peroxidase
MEKITFKGKPATLAGYSLKTGEWAQNFIVMSKDMQERTLFDYLPKIKVITTFPSLDTSLCDMQVKEFNKQAGGLDKNVAILGISRDLPFAQKRFCQANDIKNLETLSDYAYGYFGYNYGLLVKELRLLARAALIIDPSGQVRYRQVTGELGEALDYKAVLSALKDVVEKPFVAAGLEPPHCLPCQKGDAPFSFEEAGEFLKPLKGWEILEGKKIFKKYEFKSFEDAKLFTDCACSLAVAQGHHPGLTLTYNKVKVTLSTHAVAGLTKNDFIMAGLIDNISV